MHESRFWVQHGPIMGRVFRRCKEHRTGRVRGEKIAGHLLGPPLGPSLAHPLEHSPGDHFYYHTAVAGRKPDETRATAHVICDPRNVQLVQFGFGRKLKVPGVATPRIGSIGW